MPLDENNTEIRDLWLKGLTGSEIAKQLGVTRNSVMGKLHRMRHAGLLAGKALNERMKAISAMGKKQPPEPSPPILPIVEREPQKPKPEPTPEPVNLFVCEEVEAPVEKPTKPIPLDKLTPKSCRFIINSGDPKDFLFCGEPKKGSSYCEEHENLCYYRVPKKNEEE